jgi:glycyl-tRNA synthetase
VIETSIGLDRLVLVLLANAYHEEEVEGESRVVLRLHPKLSPIKAAVFPLVKKDGMPEIAREIEEDLRGAMTVFYDASGSIGRRYRRQDEAGTPFCITVDGQTVEDGTVTVRDRDTLEQVRVPSGELRAHLLERLAGAGS